MAMLIEIEHRYCKPSNYNHSKHFKKAYKCLFSYK